MSVAKSAGVPFTFKGKVARGISFPFQGKERSFGFLLNFNRNWEGSAGCPSNVRGGGSSGFPFNFKVAGASGVLLISKGFETEPFGFPLKFRGGSSGVIFDFRRMAMPWISMQLHKVGL